MKTIVKRFDCTSDTYDPHNRELMIHSRYRRFDFMQQDVEQIQVTEWYQCNPRSLTKATAGMKLEKFSSRVEIPQDIMHRVEGSKTNLYFCNRRSGLKEGDIYQRYVQITVNGILKEGVSGASLVSLYDTCWEAYVIKRRGQFKQPVNCSEILSSDSSGTSLSPMSSSDLDLEDIDEMFHEKISDMFSDAAE